LQYRTFSAAGSVRPLSLKQGGSVAGDIRDDIPGTNNAPSSKRANDALPGQQGQIPEQQHEYRPTSLILLQSASLPHFASREQRQGCDVTGMDIFQQRHFQ
jgi:hypothetical protein